MVIVKLKLFISHEVFFPFCTKEKGEGDAQLLSLSKRQVDNRNMGGEHVKKTNKGRQQH